MPIARYFAVVGSALVVLLLIADWCLPTPPAMFGKQLVIDRSIIRIKSAHKWPEKIVLDTNQPTRTPPAVEEAPPAQVVRLRPDEAGGQSNLEAMAELNPDPPLAAVDHPPLRTKRGLSEGRWATLSDCRRRETRSWGRARQRGVFRIESAWSELSPGHNSRSRLRADTRGFASLEKLIGKPQPPSEH